MKKILCFMFAFAVLAAVAETIELAVTAAGGTLSVAVPESVPGNLKKLYLVWDAVDKGENVAAWEGRRVCEDEITAGDTYAFDLSNVPSGHVYRVIGASDIELIDGYIALTGTQYIDTGVSAGGLNGFDVRFRYTGNISDEETWVGIEGVIIGSVYRTNTGDARTINNFAIRPNLADGKEKTRLRLFHRSWHPDDSNNPGKAWFDFSEGAWKTPHTLAVFDKQAFLDGEKAFLTRGGYLTPATRTQSILLGNAWHSYGSTDTIDKFGNAEWHYVKLYASDAKTLVAHFVPALTNGVAALYDTVSGKCVLKTGTAATGAAEYDPNATVTNIFPVAVSGVYTNAGRRAVWDGAAWACTTNNVTVEGGTPDAETLVVLDAGALPSNLAGLTFGKLHLSGTLSADSDLSGLAVSQEVVQVEYLDAPVGSYIDTGFKPNQDTHVRMDVYVQGVNENWFGVHSDSTKVADANFNSKQIKFIMSNDEVTDTGGIFSGYGDNGATSTKSWPAIGSGKTKNNRTDKGFGRYIVDFDKGHGIITKKDDGSVVYDMTRAENAFQMTYDMYLFAVNAAGRVSTRSTQGTIRCYSCQVYDNGTLVRDYVPAKRGDVYGFYEKVSGAFVEKSGDGAAFSGGSETGTTLVPSRTAVFDVDLAGYTLSFPNIFDGCSGEITDTVGGGEVQIAVAGGDTAVNGSVSFTGALKLVKEGAGTFVAAKPGQTYTGGTEVVAGVLKSAVSRAPWGSPGANVVIEDEKPLGDVSFPSITVASGAAFDWAGRQSAAGTPYSFTIAGTGPEGVGGALVNSVPCFENDTWNCNAIADLTLTADATIGGYPLIGISFSDETAGVFQHTLTLNDHTLSIELESSDLGPDNWQAFMFRCVKAAGTGAIVFSKAGGAKTPFPSFSPKANDLSGVTFTLEDGSGFYTDDSALTVGSFIDNRTAIGRDAQAARAITVLDCFKPASATLYRSIAFGDGATLDLSALSAPLDLSAATLAAAGASVRVDVGTRRFSSKTPFVSWTETPSGLSDVTFTSLTGGRRCVVEKRADGLYLKAYFAIILW